MPCFSDESILKFHVEVDVGRECFVVFVFPEESENVHMEKCIVPSICDLAGLFFDDGFFLFIVVLAIFSVHLVLMRCKFDVVVGIEKKIAFYEIGSEIVNHNVF